MKVFTDILRILITLPIWFYLVWWLLVHSNAGELQMFLFWVYVPVTMLLAGLQASYLHESAKK